MRHTERASVIYHCLVSGGKAILKGYVFIFLQKVVRLSPDFNVFGTLLSGAATEKAQVQFSSGHLKLLCGR